MPSPPPVSATPRGGLLRAAPLLRVSPGNDRVVVGRVNVIRTANGGTSLDLDIKASWCLRDHGWCADASADGEVAASIRHEIGEVADDPAEITAAAKRIAEESRNAVAQIRALRYGVEQRLTVALREHREEDDALASIIELGQAVSRAQDEAREAAREGLWLWKDDAGDWYQRHRRLRDSTLLPAPGTEADRRAAEAGHLPAWLYVHDAAVRQCEAMEQQLAEEASVLRRLLDGAATISTSRDARAQESLNLIAGIAAIGLGLPALVISLYGADAYLPLDSPRQFALLLPVILAGGLAATVGLMARRNRARTLKPELIGILLVLATACALLLAGVIAPAPSP